MITLYMVGTFNADFVISSFVFPFCIFLTSQMYNYKISFKTIFIVFTFFNIKKENEMVLKPPVLIWKVTFVETHILI